MMGRKYLLLGRMARVFLLLLLCHPIHGCALTLKVWNDGLVRESLHQVAAVRVSPGGDIGLLYRASIWRTKLFWLLPLDKNVYFPDCSLRWLILARQDICDFRQRELGSDYLVVPSGTCDTRVRPGDPTVFTWDYAVYCRTTREWKGFPVLNIEDEAWRAVPRLPDDLYSKAHELRMRLDEREKRDAEREAYRRSLIAECRNSGRAFQFKGAVELPYDGDDRIVVVVPKRTGRSPWSYPLRILLTPPAIAGDVVLFPLQLYAAHSLGAAMGKIH